MPAGTVVLLVVAALIYFGLAHRVLDRMRLTDGQALVFVGLMVAGSFIDLPLFRDGARLSVNVGGALVPLALVIYLLIRADSTRERVRALVASGITAAAVTAVARITDFDPPRADLVDPIWLFSLTAGVVGYLAGRSRRAAFIAGVLGILLTDLVHLAQVVARRMPATVSIGGAGVFDTVVLAGVIAVGLAELVGEGLERLRGGPSEGPGSKEADGGFEGDLRQEAGAADGEAER